jgi:hypothetical protein
VLFGPFFDAQSRSLSYEVIPPSGETGAKQFLGAGTIDVTDYPVWGLNTIEPAPPHPADNDPADWQMTLTEAAAYAAAWRQGRSWSGLPAIIPIDYVTRAGALAKGGGIYAFDPGFTQAPLWWTNSAVAILPVLSTNMVWSQMVPAFMPAENFTVTIAVQPPSGTKVYAVEDQFPASWTATAISHNGQLDLVNSKVKWGPFFDAMARNVSYQVAPPASLSGAAHFMGAGSFDGSSVAIAGQRILSMKLRLERASKRADGCFEFSLAGMPGQTYEIQTSTNLLEWSHWLTVTNTTGALLITDPVLMTTFPQRFYRATGQ